VQGPISCRRRHGRKLGSNLDTLKISLGYQGLKTKAAPRPTSLAVPPAQPDLFFADKIERLRLPELRDRRLRRPYFHSGGRSPGDVSHSVICEPISAWRALRKMASRTAPRGSNLASSRRRFASSARRDSREWICWKRRRRCMTFSPVLTGPNPYGSAPSILICSRR
jgi:hypothetical protein